MRYRGRIVSQLGGTIYYDWQRNGLKLTMQVAAHLLGAASVAEARSSRISRATFSDPKLICLKAPFGDLRKKRISREIVMWIYPFVGYVAFLIALGFAIGAVFWAADKHGLLDRISGPTHAKHHWRRLRRASSRIKHLGRRRRAKMVAD